MAIGRPYVASAAENQWQTAASSIVRELRRFDLRGGETRSAQAEERDRLPFRVCNRRHRSFNVESAKTYAMPDHNLDTLADLYAALRRSDELQLADVFAVLPYDIGLGTAIAPTCELWDLYADRAAVNGFQAPERQRRRRRRLAGGCRYGRCDARRTQRSPPATARRS